MNAQLTLPQLVYRHARLSPGSTALTSVGQGSLTWSELWRDSCRWAGWLKGAHIDSGDRVAVLIPQSLEANVLWMGCCILGAIEVSINYQFRGEWLRQALQVSSAKVIVLSHRFLEQLLPVLENTNIESILIYDAAPENIPPLPNGIQLIATDPLRAQAANDEMPDSSIFDLAAILYTSGTTGSSKAVQISWFMLHELCETYGKYINTPSPVFYFPYATYHLSGRVAIYCAALTGGRAVVREVFSTTGFWNDVREHGCTWTILFSAPARFLLGAPESESDRDHPLDLVLMNPLIPEADTFKERFGVRLFTTYGMTEVGVVLRSSLEDAVSANSGCCGRPERGIEVRLLDADNRPVERGQIGQLVIRSEYASRLTSGYQGAPEATDVALRNGWFHTGDMFYLGEDDNYYYVDRSKDMIRRRGENISCIELESAILTHPCVGEAAAVSVKSSIGEEEILVAIVPKLNDNVDPVQLTTYLLELVPRYAIPRYVRIVESIPRTQSTERIQRHVIREQGVTVTTWDRLAERINT